MAVANTIPFEAKIDDMMAVFFSLFSFFVANSYEFGSLKKWDDLKMNDFFFLLCGSYEKDGDVIKKVV
ncbi:hypothetical protein Hanom_Chr10g00959851 [Helianthus anomalus]